MNENQNKILNGNPGEHPGENSNAFTAAEEEIRFDPSKEQEKKTEKAVKKV